MVKRTQGLIVLCEKNIFNWTKLSTLRCQLICQVKQCSYYKELVGLTFAKIQYADAANLRMLPRKCFVASRILVTCITVMKFIPTAIFFSINTLEIATTLNIWFILTPTAQSLKLEDKISVLWQCQIALTGGFFCGMYKTLSHKVSYIQEILYLNDNFQLGPSKKRKSHKMFYDSKKAS